jgi:hypothetical protein
LKTVKFAFIGCGKIAHCHADVIKHLGHTIEAVVARGGSVNIDGFAEKYAVGKKMYDVEEFLKYWGESDNAIDCILVCTPWDVTENVLRQLLPLGVPVMSEKPAVLSSAGLEYLKEKYETRNLFVAYNRRFYDFIPPLKELIQNESVVCVDILSAEPCETIMEKLGEEICAYMLYFYSSHVIDLMYYLFDDIEIKNAVRTTSNGKTSWVSDLYAGKHNCPVQMKILMDCPQNSYFKIYFEKKVLVLCPFEKMILYDKLKKEENASKAIYTPSVQTELNTDDTFKPGFVNQMNYFIENFVFQKNSSFEHIRQLSKVTAFCDALGNFNKYT